MSEEKKSKEKEYDLLGDSFKLSSQVMSDGYDATIDGRRFVIGFAKDYRGRRLSQFASICTLHDSPDGSTWMPVNPPQYTLSGLTMQQLYELAHAHVIDITEEQEPHFQKLFRGYLKPKRHIGQK